MLGYKLRPHHGLCIHYFRGEGYNHFFVENMKNIISELEKNPSLLLVSDADNVCLACPNRIGEKDCIFDEKVLRYDQRVLELCNLRPSQQLTWEEFTIKIQECILTPGLRTSVCHDCQWNYICNE